MIRLDKSSSMRNPEPHTSINKFQFPILPSIDLSKTIVASNPNKALHNNGSHIDYKYCDNIRKKLNNKQEDDVLVYPMKSIT